MTTFNVKGINGIRIGFCATSQRNEWIREIPEKKRRTKFRNAEFVGRMENSIAIHDRKSRFRASSSSWHHPWWDSCLFLKHVSSRNFFPDFLDRDGLRFLPPEKKSRDRPKPGNCARSKFQTVGDNRWWMRVPTKDDSRDLTNFSMDVKLSFISSWVLGILRKILTYSFCFLKANIFTSQLHFGQCHNRSKPQPTDAYFRLLGQP